MIARKKPDSLTELADLAERSESNLSRTLTTMSRYGRVDLQEGQRGTPVPRVPYDRDILDIQSEIEKLLRRIFEKCGDSEIEIKKEWTCQLQKKSTHTCVHCTKYGVFGPR